MEDRSQEHAGRDPAGGELTEKDLEDARAALSRIAAAAEIRCRELCRRVEAPEEWEHELQEQIKRILDKIAADLQNGTEDKFSLLEDITDLLTNDDITTNAVFDAYYVRLFIEAELKKPEYGGKTITDLIENNADLASKAIDAARSALEKAKAETQKLPQLTYKEGYTVKTPTDKLIMDFFALNATVDELSGQRGFLQYERTLPAKPRNGKKKDIKEITLIYDIVQDENVFKGTGLEKKFDYYDLFVAAILDNLYDEENRIVSLTKIWHELGGKGTPGEKHISKLVNSLKRGMSTIMTIDDIEVQRAWGNKRSKQIVSPVMPVQMENERYTANGQIADGVVHIMGHTPFYMVAAPLKHITEWDKDVLRLYDGRRTPRYYNVLWYLLRNIGWMRNPNTRRSNKITYKELYAHNGDKSSRDRQLTKNMMYTLLDDVFIPAGYVSTYKEEEKGKEPGVFLTVATRHKIGAN